MVVFKKGYLEVPNVVVMDKDLNKESKLILNKILQHYSMAYYMVNVLGIEIITDENGEVFIEFPDHMIHNALGEEFFTTDWKNELYLLQEKGYIHISYHHIALDYFERVIYIPWWDEYDWDNSLEVGCVNKIQPPGKKTKQ